MGAMPCASMVAISLPSPPNSRAAICCLCAWLFILLILSVISSNKTEVDLSFPEVFLTEMPSASKPIMPLFCPAYACAERLFKTAKDC